MQQFPSTNQQQELNKRLPWTAYLQKTATCTSANIENVMIFLIEMKNNIEHNLKFSKGIAHRSTLSIKKSLVPFFPEKINRETQRDSSHSSF